MLKELDEFIHILEAEGVRVRRPDIVDYSASYSTPDWETPCGFCAANPRDPFIVIGNEIIETPMADRGRYFEAWAYRSLFKEYLKAGAKWVSADQRRHEAFSQLAARRGGLVCLHWGMGTRAAQPIERKDFQVAKDIVTSVDRYTQFTIFDTGAPHRTKLVWTNGLETTFGGTR